MAVRAGELRDLFEIREQVTSKDAAGAPVVTFRTVATVRGRLLPLSGTERMKAGGQQATLTARVRLRYFRGLTSRHVLFLVDADHPDGGRVLQLAGVPINPDGRRVEHLCDVVEVA